MDQHVIQMPCKPWTLDGLSEGLIVSHYEDVYGAAVRSLNVVRNRLATLDPAEAPGYDLRALKREELSAAGSVALHELYFASLGGDGAVLFTGIGTGRQIAEPLAAALAQRFGSVTAWRREFIALARAVSGGSGWVLLSYSRRDGHLSNYIAFEDAQAMTDAAPLLALDMYEHAYHREFGANATAYIDAFMRNVDWTAAADRFTAATQGRSVETGGVNPAAPGITVEELAARLIRGESIQVIDARPKFHFSRSVDMMRGAIYRDPERVDEWSKELSPDVPVAVYCAYGFNVGCAVTAVLRQRGFDARFVEGGLSAWYAAGGERARPRER